MKVSDEVRACRCCGKQPTLEVQYNQGRDPTYSVRCPYCGRVTRWYRQWWIAEQEWNCDRTHYEQDHQMEFWYARI